MIAHLRRRNLEGDLAPFSRVVLSQRIPECWPSWPGSFSMISNGHLWTSTAFQEDGTTDMISYSKYWFVGLSTEVRKCTHTWSCVVYMNKTHTNTLQWLFTQKWTILSLFLTPKKIYFFLYIYIYIYFILKIPLIYFIFLFKNTLCFWQPQHFLEEKKLRMFQLFWFIQCKSRGT